MEDKTLKPWFSENVDGDIIIYTKDRHFIAEAHWAYAEIIVTAVNELSALREERDKLKAMINKMANKLDDYDDKPPIGYGYACKSPELLYIISEARKLSSKE